MKHRLSILALTLSLVASLAACDDGGGSVSLDGLAEAYENAYCARLVRCGRYADTASCKADLELNVDAIRASIDAGRTTYDGEQAAACISALRGASCDSFDADNRADVPACDNAFHGTVADGGVCFASQDCVSGSCEESDCGMACCSGICNPTVAEVAIGGSCATAPCVDGSFCSETNICTALVAAGQPCDGDFSCTYGLYCTEAGTCSDAPGRGMPCPDGTCSDIGDRCDQATTTCVALAKRGEACPAGFAGLFVCQSPLTCDQTALTCGDPPAIGQPCQFVCADGAFCGAASTCEALKATGTACDSDGECASRFCDDTLTTPACAVEPVCGAGV